MKKLLIVNNNMYIGGIQKALIGLLDEICDQYDVTLLLFHKDGALLDEIPKGVVVKETRSLYRYMGMAQRDCVTAKDKLLRGLFAGVTKIFGKRYVIRLFGKTVCRDELGTYDVVISCIQGTNDKSFYGGTAEYALDFPEAGRRVCYVHCDYAKSGTACRWNDRMYEKFDAIACVSEGVRDQFLELLPGLREKTHAVYNPINYQKINELAEMQPYEYASDHLNLLTVARLSPEKGIDRVIRALAKIRAANVRYYVLGEGSARKDIEALIRECDLQDCVCLLGESDNPYRYMKNADLLILPSYHEAAPVVYQEARILGLPVLSTRTLSTEEMVGEQYGFIVDNTDQAIAEELCEIIKSPTLLSMKKEALRELRYDDSAFEGQFRALIGERIPKKS